MSIAAALGGGYAPDAKRDRKFGSLITAGPFPVRVNGQGGEPSPPNASTWFFPRPADLQGSGLSPSLLPSRSVHFDCSSLPEVLEYAVVSCLPPAKHTGAKVWLARDAFQRYLTAERQPQGDDAAVEDGAFCDSEHTVGIEINDETGTAGQGEAMGKIYSAHYLRLREGWRLGVVASAQDKLNGSPDHKRDLLAELLQENQQIVIGGQQRTCTATRLAKAALELPLGKSQGFCERDGKFLVKWVLLSPAIWPEMAADKARNITAHPGGWLPNWICPDTGAVLLKSADTARLPGETRPAWRERIRRMPALEAKLVATLVPKPVVVTGWALPDKAGEEPGGAQSTHLAVPAGAVYYFEADSAEHAQALAGALNWHGTSPATELRNHRSTLLGEKGFGLGVCSTWDFFEDVSGRSANRQS